MLKYFYKINKIDNYRLKDFDLEEYAKEGYKIVDKEKEVVEKKLDEYKFPENSNEVNLSEVIKDWFPLGQYDIFLSHSHSDEKKAIAISYYLKKWFDLDCFVDSCVWGYAETLLKKLDKKYCKKNGKTFDYDCRNGTTAHVHLMLNSALMEMMQSCSFFVFLQTDNSLQTNRKGVENWTYSSWIYSELNMSRIMFNILNSNKMVDYSRRRVVAESKRLPMGYSNVDTRHLNNVSLLEFSQMLSNSYE